MQTRAIHTALFSTLVASVPLSNNAIHSRERSSCGARSYSCGPICTSTGSSRSSCMCMPKQMTLRALQPAPTEAPTRCAMFALRPLRWSTVHLEGHKQALLLNALLQGAEHALHLPWP